MFRRVFAALTLLAAPLTAAADMGVNFYGLAYHLDRGRARDAGLDNEIIAGLGLRYRVAHGERLEWVFDIAAYRDSGRNTARLAGGGLLWAGGNWRLGGALAALKSETYNRGEAFIAPVPLAAYELRAMTLNLVFIPRWRDVNDVATLGFWVTWWLDR